MSFQVSFVGLAYQGKDIGFRFILEFDCGTFLGLAQIILFSILPNFSEKNTTECRKSQNFNQGDQI
jgi:hypothetical protein